MKKLPIERAAEFAQNCIAKMPVVILGSGASIPHGIPGMGPLADALKSIMLPRGLTDNEYTQWEHFTTQVDALGFEAALSRVQFSNEQTILVVKATRDFLLPHDVRAFQGVLCDRRRLPLSRLYQHLFKSTHKLIDIVTSNYDRLAEYAADCAEVRHYVGFSSGYINRRTNDDIRLNLSKDAARTVCIWKVHGSFDWFRHTDDSVFALPMCHDTPIDFTPVMVTPGIEKYKLTYDEPFRTVLRCADQAMENARSFLCVGFGFNDHHLQTKLVERSSDKPIPITVVTQQLTPQAKAFLLGGRCQRFLAFEQCPTGTRMYTHDDTEGIDLVGEDLWKFDSFLKFTIGAEA